MTLLEARPRLGGATWSFTRNGLRFDNGQHVYLRCCTAYQRFLARIGTADLAPLQDHLELPVLRPRPGLPPVVSYLRRSRLPAPLHLVPALLSYRHVPLGGRLRLGQAVLALLRARTTDEDLDGETFAAFLSRHGQTPEVVDGLFDLIALPTTNVHVEDASAALVTKVFRTGLLGDPGAADIGWSKVPLSVLHGEAAERALGRNGVVIRRRARVEEVTVSTGQGVPRAVGVTVNGEHLDADAVVLAVPHEAAASLLPAGLGCAEDLSLLGASPIIDVHLVFDRKVCDYAVAAGSGSPVQFVFDRTESSGLQGDGQVLAISVSAADAEHGDKGAALIERYHAAVVDLFPKARDASLLDAVVSREHTATFRATPGTARLRPGSETGVEGLFLAGAWTDTGWPATMEGAVRSGNRAAWHALQALGLGQRSPAWEAVA